MKPEKFDQIRAALKGAGLAVYAYRPDGPVTVELSGPGGSAVFEGATLAEALEKIAPERSVKDEIQFLFS